MTFTMSNDAMSTSWSLFVALYVSVFAFPAPKTRFLVSATIHQDDAGNTE